MPARTDTSSSGWIRLNFNYFISEEVFEFLLNAVEFLADEGWKLLPYYGFDPRTGRWQPREGPPSAPMRLHDIGYERGRMDFISHHATESESVLSSYLEEANDVVASAPANWAHLQITESSLPTEFERVRWFVLPEEIARGSRQIVPPHRDA